jgi:hypothetical protein
VNPDKEQDAETEDDDIDQSILGGVVWDVQEEGESHGEISR